MVKFIIKLTPEPARYTFCLTFIVYVEEHDAATNETVLYILYFFMLHMSFDLHVVCTSIYQSKVTTIFYIVWLNVFITHHVS